MKTPLVLWGGVDISPHLYGELRNPHTQFANHTKDEEEIALVKEAIDNKQPIVGVCRGAQLLCVLNGGSIYQHSIPHRQDHSIRVKGGEVFENVSAGHHQIMRPENQYINPKINYIVYGYNPNPVLVWIDEKNTREVYQTAEVVWYPDTKCLCIQPHPEWAHPYDPFVIWLNKLMRELEIDYEF